MIIPTKRLNIKVRPHRRKGQREERWLVDIPAKITGTGKRARRFFDTKSEAEQFRDRLIIDIRRDALNIHKRTSHVSFAEAVEHWHAREIDRIARKLKQPISLEKDLIYLKSLLPNFASHDIAHIDIDAVAEYQKARLAAGKSPVTINSEVRTLKTILNWTRSREWIDRVPTFEMLREPVKKYELPSLAELNLIRSHLRPMQATIFRLIVETGCRQSEAFQLRWQEVDFENLCLHFYEADGRTTKNEHSARTLPITSALAAEINNLPRDLMWVFPNRNLDGHTKNIQKALSTAVEKSGVKRNGEPIKLTVKMLRKFYATAQDRISDNMRLLQKMLGHAPGSEVTDRRYIQSGWIDRAGVLDMEDDVVAKKLATAWDAIGNPTKKDAGQR